MSGVSYASPTYYADRLCERGRLYIRKYYLGDDDDLEADLKDKKKTLEDDLKKKRQAKYGAKEHKKTAEERKLEKEHAEHVDKTLKDFVFGKIRDEFCMFKDDPEENLRWQNPYSRKLELTMFWM